MIRLKMVFALISACSIERDRFVDQHQRNVVDNRVQELSILPDKSAGELAFDGLPSAIGKLSGRDRTVQPGDRLLGRRREWLAGFGTDEYFEQLFADHSAMLPSELPNVLRRARQ